MDGLAPDAAKSCDIERYLELPLHVYDIGEAPKLDTEGIHLLEGGFDDASATLEDLEYDQCLLVAGELRCKELWTSGFVFVAGALMADRVVARSEGNNVLFCDRLITKELVERGHTVVVLRDLDAKILYSQDGTITAEDEAKQIPKTDAKKVFLPEFLTSEGEVDWDKWTEAVKAGKAWAKQK